MPNAIVVVDGSGRIRLVNGQMERLFGYSGDELVGEQIEILVPVRYRRAHPGLRQGFFVDVRTRLMGAGRDLYGLRKDGTEFPVEIGLNPVETDEGTLVLSSIVDITAHHRAERRFRLAIESAPSGMVMIDPDGLIVLVNSQAEKLFGYQRQELIGQPVSVLVPERVRSKHETYRAGFFARPEARPMGAGRDLFGRRRDGTEFPLEIGLNPIETEEGVFALSAIVDITERKQLEQELRLRLEELATADRQKNEFLAMLGHELRNPLAPMRNALHLMKMPGVDEHVVQNAREIMERQVHHLVRLVDDLLDVSRIISGRIELRQDAIDVVDAARRAIETAQPAIDSQGHQLVVSFPSEPAWVEGDLVRLAQVVANLLTNAAKYTPQAGRIWLTVDSTDEDVFVSVRDRGIGIDAEFLPRVFDLFVQADSSLARSYGGLGIGLTLVKRLMTMHRGSVSASSAGIGHGSEFVVRLPLSKRGSVRAPESNATQPRITDALERRVLVVDDNVDAAKSTAAILELAGYSVRCEHDGRSALEAAKLYQPDVIVLDIGLPDMTGYEVAARLRAHPKFNRIPLVAVTGYGQEPDRRRAKEVGIDQHLTKPVDPETLRAFIAASRMST
jgi:two-component system CheB/CheR fusion protein